MHAAQVAWNALSRLELMLRKKEMTKETDMGSDKAAFKVGDKVTVYKVEGVGEVVLLVKPLCDPRREVFRHLPVTSGVKVTIRRADDSKDHLRDHVSYIVKFERSGLHSTHGRR